MIDLGNLPYVAKYVFPCTGFAPLVLYLTVCTLKGHISVPCRNLVQIHYYYLILEMRET